MSELFDCAICGSKGVSMGTHYHKAEFGRVYDQPKKSRFAYSLRFIGYAPREASRELFTRFGILEFEVANE